MWEFELNISTLLYFLPFSYSFIGATFLVLLKGDTSHRWERSTFSLQMQHKDLNFEV